MHENAMKHKYYIMILAIILLTFWRRQCQIFGGSRS